MSDHADTKSLASVTPGQRHDPNWIHIGSTVGNLMIVVDVAQTTGR
ncbi:hypothetical protein [Actinoplanes sp. NPDC026623]